MAFFSIEPNAVAVKVVGLFATKRSARIFTIISTGEIIFIKNFDSFVSKWASREMQTLLMHREQFIEKSN